ncbi:PD-(D/E)XK nuclease family protein [Zeaxanthinibacter sp. PT1]|uniref:PD-(D/E)XK nuclease family protein n=1 Tax=Zeaxanthinibacter TaxID=561554 RepID=UPI00234A5636|nr:PD-(D/E)XK nuclease family protein [Zeaxanthinibacter sp. PT1]MDC6350838.1 PD-(D/E)XK nuclease family protein [Zeaxanthinibacter sp. PT1]
MHKSFLEEVVAKSLEKHSSLSDTVFILPSKRAGSYLQDYLRKSVKKTIFAPRIYSIETFIEELSGLKYATNTQLLFELYSSYCEAHTGDHESFYQFSKWGQLLLQDFNEIDRYLVPASELFSYLSSAREIEHWSASEDQTPMIKNYLRFWSQLQDIYLLFSTRLKRQGLGYQGMVYRTACEKIKTYTEQHPGDQHIFIGFNALNKAESEIIQFLLGENKAEIYWDADPYFIDDPQHEAGHFIRSYRQRWPYFKENSLAGLQDNFSGIKHIRVIGVPKNVSQVKYVSSLLREEAVSQGSRTAVVLGDEGLLNPLVHALPDGIGPINITMGYPLGKTPVAGLFNQLFALHLDKVSLGWYYKNVLALLSHPYVALLNTADPSGGTQNIQQAIKEKNLSFLNQQKLADETGAHPYMLSLLFFEEANNPKIFLAKCTELIRTLKDYFQQNEQFLALEHLYGFYTLFNELETHLQTYSEINDLRTLESLYRSLLESETVDFRGEPLEGLQVMGMLESRNLDFDTVILTSVNEGVLPSGKAHNSLIPFDIKRSFGLPTYKEKDAVYSYHFYRLLQRAKKVYLLYNSVPDTLEGGEKSRLISQLLSDPPPNTLVEEQLASPDIKPDLHSPVTIEKDALLQERLKDIAAKGFSPTSLTNYIRDPLTFYRKSVLGIQDVEEVEETVSASVFGTIVHDSLEALYTPFIGEYLSPQALDQLHGKIEKTVREAYAKNYGEVDISYGQNLIVYHVIVRYLERFITMEKKDAEHHTIRIIGLEKNMKVTVEVPGISFPVHLRGQIDRIDEFDGVLRIIDYKTGQASSGNTELIEWDDMISEEKYNKAFQLLAYAYMYYKENPTSDMEAGIIAFKSLNSGLIRFATKKSSHSSVKDKNFTINGDTLNSFKVQLHKLLQEICNPAIPFTEKSA